jgi:hypothetical protein
MKQGQVEVVVTVGGSGCLFNDNVMRNQMLFLMWKRWQVPNRLHFGKWATKYPQRSTLVLDPSVIDVPACIHGLYALSIGVWQVFLTLCDPISTYHKVMIPGSSPVTRRQIHKSNHSFWGQDIHMYLLPMRCVVTRALLSVGLPRNTTVDPYAVA